VELTVRKAAVFREGWKSGCRHSCCFNLTRLIAVTSPSSPSTEDFVTAKRRSVIEGDTADSDDALWGKGTDETEEFIVKDPNRIYLFTCELHIDNGPPFKMTVTRSHLITISRGFGSKRGEGERGNFARAIRNARPVYGSFLAKQRSAPPSNAVDSAAGRVCPA
jgi:hypothetical protein